MSNYKLHLIPTDKSNAPICKVESVFQIKDFDGDVLIYEEGKLYNRRDLIRQVMASDTFPDIKKMIIEEHIQPMHLYLTDNQRILKGVWCIQEHTDRIYKAEESEGIYYMTGDSRIICTSDVDFRQDIIINFNGEKTVEENVPNFHHMFLATYISMYNKGQQLTNNIEPEIELVGEKQRPKFAVDENNIMTVLIKVFFMTVGKQYSRNELDEHLLAVMNLGMGLRQSQLNGTDLRSGNEVLEEYKLKNL
jgi:hypothetical protein